MVEAIQGRTGDTEDGGGEDGDQRPLGASVAGGDGTSRPRSASTVNSSESPVLEAELEDLVLAVRTNGLEGLVAKRWNSRYEPGQRTGAWLKHRVNQGREFVIGGYTLGPRSF